MSGVGRLARRRFLRGLGGATLALPFLPSLHLQRRAHAATPAPKRFIFVFTSNGQRIGNWYPKGNVAWTAAGTNIRETSLVGGGGISPISHILGPEFDTLRGKLLLLRGLDFIQRKGKGHEAPAPLAGVLVTPSVTIDQIIAQSPKFYPTAPAVRSVHMMIKTDYQSPTSCSVSMAGGTPAGVPHETNVLVSWKRLFGDLAATTDPLATKRDALRLSVMDRFRAEYDLLRASPKLSSDDKRRLDAHLAHLQDLQKSLVARRTATCTAVAQPTPPAADSDSKSERNLPALTTLNIDLLVAAIKCDRTRVATLMLCPGTDLRTFSFLPGGALGEHHSISHDVYSPAATTKLGAINNWYAKQVADLLRKLDTVEDPTTGATYLDNSIVYWGNEDGVSDGDAHDHYNMPVLLAGGAGGFLKPGRYIDYREVTGTGAQEMGAHAYYNNTDRLPGSWDFKGRPYNSLLITLLQSMGLAPADYEKPGQPGFGDYLDNVKGQFSVSDGQKLLPGVTI